MGETNALGGEPDSLFLALLLEHLSNIILADLVGDIFCMLAFSICILACHTVEARPEVNEREEEAAIEFSTEATTNKHLEEAVTGNVTVRPSTEPEATQMTLQASEVSFKKATADAWKSSIRPSKSANVRRGKYLDSSKYLPAGHADCFNLSFDLSTSGMDPLMAAETLPLNSCISKGRLCPLLERMSMPRRCQPQEEQDDEEIEDGGEDTNGWTVV
ncbi:hypothetical protein PV04_07024 [Phialophora macrospora]|uniref:Uncharacterized protein n=1 Tax=Phialophora macrospora TaxID=1851006 RepID=A0A0D2E0A1_9EURO|nr:hypothetical protein PV04_07024 [Phialophora macrospora]